MGWLALAIGLAWGGPEGETPHEALPQPDIGTLPSEVLQAARAAAGLSLPERMERVSAVLMGRPYVNDPMGEGVAPDADPIARYDAFDCLTFAEEVLALSMSPDPAHAADVRRALRYDDGEVAYAKRRHFMELQWIPAVVRDGWLIDSTASYGEVIHLEKQVDAALWRGWAPRSRFPLSDEELPQGTMALDVLPLETAIQVVDDIRPGSLILTVRTDKPGVPIWTTHVGFVVPTERGLRLRHATKLGSGGTREQDLRWYLEHIRSYRWKVAGIAILEPVDFGPRALAPAEAQDGT